MAAKSKEVRMVARISGTRDGKAWPAPGQTISLPEDEANALLAAGSAVDTSVTETATTTTLGVETATTPGNRSVREGVTAAEAKAAADQQAAERAAAEKSAAAAAAKLTEDQAKKSTADAKAEQGAKK